MKMQQQQKKLLIICGYFKGESYGLLGPQMAATIINDHSDYSAIVIGVTNEDEKSALKKAVYDYFGTQKPVIGFSSLGGRPDLFEFAKELKDEGAVTILAGPQAAPDFKGETEWEKHPHRFKGFSDHFSFAIHGPAQQILPLLEADFKTDFSKIFGLVYKKSDNQIIQNASTKWDDAFLSKVDWNTLHRMNNDTFEPFTITTAQVLSQIGCPHAGKQKEILIDYPAAIAKEGKGKAPISITQKGCSFCDVATDKGFIGALSKEAVKGQLQSLPEMNGNLKITFELINESPLPRLEDLFQTAENHSIKLSQINLTLRADYFLKGIPALEKALEKAQKMNVRILLSSIGFESFDDTILKNLNKGVEVKTNLETVRQIRKLKATYPRHLGYLKDEGANHGFIHPTPWDNGETGRNINKAISLHQLTRDILPPHSTPLIIHHASGLADWIRQIEINENIEFARVGTTIGWWQIGDEFLL